MPIKYSNYLPRTTKAAGFSCISQVALTFCLLFLGVFNASAQNLGFGAAQSPWAPLKKMIAGDEKKKPSPESFDRAQNSPIKEIEDPEDGAYEIEEAPIHAWIERRAPWTSLFDYQDARALYIPSQMTLQEGMIFTSVLFDYPKDLPFSTEVGEKMHRSAIGRVRISCSNSVPVSLMAVSLFSMSMGEGHVVGEITRPSNLSATIFGQSVAAQLIERSKHLCQ